jgi:hypothetical protein
MNSVHEHYWRLHRFRTFNTRKGPTQYLSTQYNTVQSSLATENAANALIRIAFGLNRFG